MKSALKKIVVAQTTLPKVFIIAIGLGSAACAQEIPTETGGHVKDCQPCTFNIGDDLPAHRFFFELESGNEGNIIRKIVVKHSPHADALQTLTIDDMTPILSGVDFFFEATDINFDGYNDLLLITSQGIANSYAKYWLFNNNTQQFEYLDELPLLSLDSATKTLSSYERGGHGGMIFEKKRYKFNFDSLEVIWMETQNWDEKRRAYINIIKTLEAGRLVSSQETIVQPPE